MQPSVIACDLGTGGLKAAVFDATGRTLAERLVSYETYYPKPSRHEQRPQDWWRAIAACLRICSPQPAWSARRSGRSCFPGTVSDASRSPPTERFCRPQTPIWSDGRAEAEAADFFRRFDETAWYRVTGNGFPAPLYPLFKILWLRRWQPEILSRARWILRDQGLHQLPPDRPDRDRPFLCLGVRPLRSAGPALFGADFGCGGD